MSVMERQSPIQDGGNYIRKNAKQLRDNGGNGAHGMLSQYYIDNKKFICPNGKSFTLGRWIKAVQEGKTVPKSSEAIQMLKDMHE
eukprot:6643096-Karenia_brevis.AAC.1